MSRTFDDHAGAICKGACAALLGVSLAATGYGGASATPQGSNEAVVSSVAQPTTEIPGELLGSWITKDKSTGLEFEADGTYVYIDTSGSKSYTEIGTFEADGQRIEYSPEEITSEEENGPTETAESPSPYVESWKIESEDDDGSDVLVTEGEEEKWTFTEVDLGDIS